MSILRGWLGEKITTLGMWLFLDKKIYRRFHNVIIPTPNGTTQIDHLLVSPFGIFVIETKNMNGWIFGSENESQWTQSFYKSKYRFQNPLHQNYRHTKCLAEYLGLDFEMFHSIVFFIGDAKFKTPMPANVMNQGLHSYIVRFQKTLLEYSDIERVMPSIQELKNDPTLTPQTHLESLQNRYASTTMCPKCGTSLVEKVAKKGPNAGSTFLACSAYPQCRYIKSKR